MTVKQAFLMATQHGGQALRRTDVGVISVGAKADLLVFRGDQPNMQGWQDPIAAVMLHANIGDIQHVLVDGEWRKRDGKLVMKRKDLAIVQQRFRASSIRLQQVWADMPQPRLEESFFGLSKYEAPEVVDLSRHLNSVLAKGASVKDQE